MLTPPALIHPRHAEIAARLRKFHQPEPHECYHNAFSVMMYANSYARNPIANEAVLYVEGWITGFVPTMVHSHGWLEIDGMVVDPTLNPERQNYFPGNRYTFNEFSLAMQEHDYRLPIFPCDNAGGGLSASFVQAYIDAMAWNIRDIEEKEKAVIEKFMLSPFRAHRAALDREGFTLDEDTRDWLTQWSMVDDAMIERARTRALLMDLHGRQKARRRVGGVVVRKWAKAARLARK